jgi:hypothetical protein
VTQNTIIVNSIQLLPSFVIIVCLVPLVYDTVSHFGQLKRMATEPSESLSPFLAVLEARFRVLGVGASHAERAAFLDTDPATYSKVVNGRIKLTRRRAAAWATKLAPNDPTGAGAVEAQLLAADRSSNRSPMSVDEFCNSLVRQGGAGEAKRIEDFLLALEPSGSVRDPLILIEYSDVPRASPDSKYQALAEPLAKAVVQGVNVGMLYPFKLPSKIPLTCTSQAMKYMAKVYDECVRTLSSLKRLAQDVEGSSKAEIDRRLRMYVPGCLPKTLTPSFQAKMFYVQWDDADDQRHHRLLQWVTSPPQDWLVFRGDHIDPKAVRDAFFPIPHAFDLNEKNLPILNSNTWQEFKPKLMEMWPELGTRCLWYSDD